MEYEILSEGTQENIRKEFETRSKEWSKEQMLMALYNYKKELDNLLLDKNLLSIAIDEYKKDPIILNPVFAYESNLEYQIALRNKKIPEMEADLQKLKGQIESTVFQIPLMQEAIDNFKELEVIEEKVE